MPSTWTPSPLARGRPPCRSSDRPRSGPPPACPSLRVPAGWPCGGVRPPPSFFPLISSTLSQNFTASSSYFAGVRRHVTSERLVTSPPSSFLTRGEWILEIWYVDLRKASILGADVHLRSHRHGRHLERFSRGGGRVRKIVLPDRRLRSASLIFPPLFGRAHVPTEHHFSPPSSAHPCPRDTASLGRRPSVRAHPSQLSVPATPSPARSDRKTSLRGPRK